ncbi:hypothetical protein mRhiFer1_009063 [Rhinolophus ferrumequinum]|uniref:Uncharacterized protein n=1 Tax=Rhinolophus ferrumequinum TaxID=59479 RepID=A0A7J7SXH0_RHIFE|nr:hypothetical protein mRhiFer1_009063 [Rhinolophus ferrumequinum]
MGCSGWRVSSKDVGRPLKGNVEGTPWHSGHPGTLRHRTAPQKPAAGVSPSASSPRDTSRRRQCPAGDATVKLAPGAALPAAQVPRLQDRAGECRASAARTEPGTAFAGAQAEAGAFAGRDRGNPETPGHYGPGGTDGGRSERRCASGVTGDPAGTAAWGARRS